MMPSASVLLPYKPRLHNTMMKTGWAEAQRRLICHRAAKTGRGIVFPGHHLQVTVNKLWEINAVKEQEPMKKTRWNNGERSAFTRWRVLLVVSGVFSAEVRVCRSNWSSCGCFFDLDSDQAASSIHAANDRHTTGKCWEGRGWLEQLPADTGQVTNSSQGWRIAAGYTDSFYTCD